MQVVTNAFPFLSSFSERLTNLTPKKRCYMNTHEESQSVNQEFQFSYFDSLWSVTPTIITLKELHRQTVSSLWKPKTESYRRLKDRPDRENEAKMTKSSMPVVIAEGVIRPNHSHATANLERMNGLAMYDFDHSNERTAEIKDLLCHLPFVAYSHTSISGEGLKVFVRLDARRPEEYPLAYAICQRTLERIAAHPCDPQCARITQPCSCVWDPLAYLNSVPEPYPWREELSADPTLSQLIPSDRTFPSGGNSYSYAPGNESRRVSSIPPATDACGYIEAFVRSFALHHPWQKGNRHESMLALGRSARCKGFSKEELEKLTSVMSVHIVGNGYTMKELQRDLFAGYQYVDLSYKPEIVSNPLTVLTTDTLVPFLPENGEDEGDDVSIKDEELRASAPCIPDEVFESLPSFLIEALKPARNRRERDILLLGLLANLSGCMPNVRINYDQRPYSPHFYLLVIAPPASGKGVLTLAGMLPESINNYLKGENKRKKEAYERELDEWEKNSRPAGKKTQTTTTAFASAPEEPEYSYLCGAPNTSRNQIINRLKMNGDLGLIINASELDMISGSIKQDCGKHDDVFRAAFQHEPVATDFKGDHQIIRAEEPRLALCLSGTPNQLPAFIRSMDNGLFSRFSGYTCEARWKFRSAAPINGQEDYIQFYKRLSHEVLDMFLLFQQSPTEVKLTVGQWEEHTDYFNRLVEEVDSEQADAPGAIIFRGALMVARIASVFTALRKAGCALSMKDYYCTDEDFHASMQIVKTTLNHSLLIGSSLPGDDVRSKPMKSYFRLRPVIESLPKRFSYKNVKDKALKEGINERSTCRYLKKLIELQYIEKQEDMYIKLKKFTDKGDIGVSCQ